MNKNPALSLIVCTYQRTRELETLFQSLAAQTFRDFEVIVIDQNPDARVKPYLKVAQSQGLDIVHVRIARPNLSGARNIGIRAARGDWVGFPDDDCWYEPDMLMQLSACFSCSDALSGAVAKWVEYGASAALPLELSWRRTRQFRDHALASFMLFFNAKMFDRVGLFDERMGVGLWFGAGEETDLVMRALVLGAVIRLYPAAQVHHRLKAPCVQGADERMELRRRARATGALYAKHGLPLLVVLRGLLAPLLRPLLRGAGVGGIRYGFAVVLGRIEGMAGWHLRHRDNPAPSVFESRFTEYDAGLPMPPLPRK
jgi:glycosyltransferase involved in cell wall biosynthesis